MRVGVIGTGHVGLITSLMLAEIGHEVIGSDQDREKVDQLRRGFAPFFEPGVSDVLQRNLATGRVAFTSSISEAVTGAQVVFICVGTPPKASGEANLVAVERAAREVARQAQGSLVVVEKSTVPAGTANRVRQTLRFERPDLSGELHVVSNPEFLREGSALQDALQPDRILVGSDSSHALGVMRELYRPVIERGAPLIETDITTAELAKHACNAFLALKVSFINSLARLCELAGADVVSVARVMGADSRIGDRFLEAGLGYGGSCFPKDLQAFERLADQLGYRFGLLSEVARINEEALDATVEKVRDGLWNLEEKRIALFGLSFKPGTDDVRFSPAIALARRLLDEGAWVVGYDPHALANAKEELPELQVAADPYDAASEAHCVVLCTSWPELKELDLHRLRDVMAYPFVVDGRNLFDPEQMRAAGFAYYGTGRPRVSLVNL